MGFDVRVTAPDLELEYATTARRGMLAGAGKVLGLSDTLAPREPEPRHGVHMTETGFTRVEPGLGDDVVAVGYDAYWAVWQEEDLEYDHPHGGQAKFLSTALTTGNDLALEEVAAALRELAG